VVEFHPEDEGGSSVQLTFSVFPADPLYEAVGSGQDGDAPGTPTAARTVPRNLGTVLLAPVRVELDPAVAAVAAAVVPGLVGEAAHAAADARRILGRARAAAAGVAGAVVGAVAERLEHADDGSVDDGESSVENVRRRLRALALSMAAESRWQGASASMAASTPGLGAAVVMTLAPLPGAALTLDCPRVDVICGSHAVAGDGSPPLRTSAAITLSASNTRVWNAFLLREGQADRLRAPASWTADVSSVALSVSSGPGGADAAPVLECRAAAGDAEGDGAAADGGGGGGGAAGLPGTSRVRPRVLVQSKPWLWAKGAAEAGVAGAAGGDGAAPQPSARGLGAAGLRGAGQRTKREREPHETLGYDAFGVQDAAEAALGRVSAPGSTMAAVFEGGDDEGTPVADADGDDSALSPAYGDAADVRRRLRAIRGAETGVRVDLGTCVVRVTPAQAALLAGVAASLGAAVSEWSRVGESFALPRVDPAAPALPEGDLATAVAGDRRRGSVVLVTMEDARVVAVSRAAPAVALLLAGLRCHVVPLPASLRVWAAVFSAALVSVPLLDGAEEEESRRALGTAASRRARTKLGLGRARERGAAVLIHRGALSPLHAPSGAQAAAAGGRGAAASPAELLAGGRQSDDSPMIQLRHVAGTPAETRAHLRGATVHLPDVWGGAAAQGSPSSVPWWTAVTAVVGAVSAGRRAAQPAGDGPAGDGRLAARAASLPASSDDDSAPFAVRAGRPGIADYEPSARVTVTAESLAATASGGRWFWRAGGLGAHRGGGPPVCLVRLGPQAVLVVETITLRTHSSPPPPDSPGNALGVLSVRARGLSLLTSASALPLDLPLRAALEAHACGIVRAEEHDLADPDDVVGNLAAPEGADGAVLSVPDTRHPVGGPRAASASPLPTALAGWPELAVLFLPPCRSLASDPRGAVPPSLPELSAAASLSPLRLVAAPPDAMGRVSDRISHTDHAASAYAASDSVASCLPLRGMPAPHARLAFVSDLAVLRTTCEQVAASVPVVSGSPLDERSGAAHAWSGPAGPGRWSPPTASAELSITVGRVQSDACVDSFVALAAAVSNLTWGGRSKAAPRRPRGAAVTTVARSGSAAPAGLVRRRTASITGRHGVTVESGLVTRVKDLRATKPAAGAGMAERSAVLAVTTPVPHDAPEAAAGAEEAQGGAASWAWWGDWVRDDAEERERATAARAERGGGGFLGGEALLGRHGEAGEGGSRDGEEAEDEDPQASMSLRGNYSLSGPGGALIESYMDPSAPSDALGPAVAAGEGGGVPEPGPSASVAESGMLASMHGGEREAGAESGMLASMHETGMLSSLHNVGGVRGAESGMLASVQGGEDAPGDADAGLSSGTGAGLLASMASEWPDLEDMDDPADDTERIELVGGDEDVMAASGVWGLPGGAAGAAASAMGASGGMMASFATATGGDGWGMQSTAMAASYWDVGAMGAGADDEASGGPEQSDDDDDAEAGSGVEDDGERDGEAEAAALPESVGAASPPRRNSSDGAASDCGPARGSESGSPRSLASVASSPPRADSPDGTATVGVGLPALVVGDHFGTDDTAPSAGPTPSHYSLPTQRPVPVHMLLRPMPKASEHLPPGLGPEVVVVSHGGVFPGARPVFRLRLRVEEVDISLHLGADAPAGSRVQGATMRAVATDARLRLETLVVGDEGEARTSVRRVAAALQDLDVLDAIEGSPVRRVLGRPTDSRDGGVPLVRLRTDAYSDALLVHGSVGTAEGASATPADEATSVRVGASVQPVRLVVGPQTIAFARAVALHAAVAAARNAGWPGLVSLADAAAAGDGTSGPATASSPAAPPRRVELMDLSAVVVVADCDASGARAAEHIVRSAVRPAAAVLERLVGGRAGASSRLQRLVDSDFASGYAVRTGHVPAALSLDGSLASAQRVLAILTLERVGLTLPAVVHPPPGALPAAAEADALRPGAAVSLVLSSWSSDILRRQVASCLAGLSAPLLPIRRIADAGAEVAEAFGTPAGRGAASQGRTGRRGLLLLPSDESPAVRAASAAGRVGAGVVRSAGVLARALAVEVLRAATGAVRAADRAVAGVQRRRRDSSASRGSRASDGDDDGGDDDGSSIIIAMPAGDGSSGHTRALPLAIVRPTRGAGRALVELLRYARRTVSGWGAGATGHETERQRERARLFKRA